MLFPYLYIMLVLNIIPFRVKSIKKAIWFLTAIFLIYVASSNIYTGDQYLLNRDYLYGTNYVPYAEILYVGFGDICRKFGANYIGYKVIWGTLISILMLKYLNYFEIEDINSFFVVWVLTSFSVEQEQSRFLYASIIFIYATHWLVSEERKDAIKYIIAIIIASQVHSLAYVYLLFGLSYFKNSFSKIVKWGSIVASILVILLYFFAGRNLSFLGNIFFSITKIERINYWFAQSTNLGFLYPWTIQFVQFFVLKFYKYFIPYYRIEGSGYEEYLNICININYLMFILFPFYLISTEFSRLQRPVSLMIILCILAGLKYIKGASKLIPIISVFIYIIIFNIFQYRNIWPFSLEHFIPMWTHVF